MRYSTIRSNLDQEIVKNEPLLLFFQTLSQLLYPFIIFCTNFIFCIFKALPYIWVYCKERAFPEEISNVDAIVHIPTRVSDLREYQRDRSSYSIG